jgi:nicotinate-nucleotide adenylyltransferase
VASADRPDTAARSLGILGGTFNPPHVGHLAMARHAREELGLEHVLLVPASIAPYKSAGGGGPDGRDPGPRHRLQMCRLAAMGEQRLSVSSLEIDRGGLSYTVDTLRSIHSSHPHARLTLILGADTAATLSSWREPAQLLELARLAVAARAGAARQRVLDVLSSTGVEGRVSFLEMPPIEVSSSMVRRRVADGQAIEDLVGPSVAAYIAEQGLYASAVASR